MFLKGDLSFNDEIYITNVRQKACTGQMRCESLKKVMESIQNADAGGFLFHRSDGCI